MSRPKDGNVFTGKTGKYSGVIQTRISSTAKILRAYPCAAANSGTPRTWSHSGKSSLKPMPLRSPCIGGMGLCTWLADFLCGRASISRLALKFNIFLDVNRSARAPIYKPDLQATDSEVHPGLSPPATVRWAGASRFTHVNTVLTSPCHSVNVAGVYWSVRNAPRITPTGATTDAATSAVPPRAPG